jgi:group I intron endonuclease
MNDLVFVYGIIYKATNLINGKIYIGQTKLKLKYRIMGHKKSKLLISKAIKKYGIENFKWEVIDSASNATELDFKEFMYIRIYNSYANTGRGYNISDGGNKNKLRGKTESEMKIVSKNFSKPKYKIIDLTNNRIFDSVKIAADYYGINIYSIYSSIKNNERANGIIFKKYREDGIYSETKHELNWGRKKVICLDDFKTFQSIKLAAEYYGLDKAALSAAIKRECYINNKQFAYYREDGMYPKLTRKNKKVICLNDSNVFQSINEAAKFYNIERSNISKAIKNKTETFRMRFSKA